MGEFSLELSEDQLQVIKWVHDFAETVVRPAAHEWDEREETPWPIIEEAAKVELYSFDFVANCFGDETGQLLPAVNEELSWGDAGIALAIFGSTLGLEVSLQDFRKDVTLEIYNEAGQLVLAYVIYRCWVSEFQALPDLDANANAVAISRLKLENEGWERDLAVTEPTEPTFVPPT